MTTSPTRTPAGTTGVPATVSTAAAYLALLRERGIERLFVNAGTDFASLVEAYAEPGAAARFPEIVVCVHENLAVSMAHGAHLGDGRPQAVMLHTSVGTANAVCAIMNAARDRIPIVLTAGRTPIHEAGPLGARNGGIHWAQEMFDQAGMLREMVRWDYELRTPHQLTQVVDRALDRARTEPGGPVYLTLPREVLAEPASTTPPGPPPPTPAKAHPAPEAVAALADRILAARFPLIVTSASGADPGTLPLLAELASRHAIAVSESLSRYRNLALDHPCHVGFDGGRVLAEADLVLFLDVDVPWIPSRATPREDAVIVQAGPDPHFGAYPMRTHRSDLSITTSVSGLLSALIAELDARGGDPAVERLDRITAFATAERTRRHELLEAEAAGSGPITKNVMNWALAQVLPADAAVVNEYWARADVLPLDGPGSYFGTPPAGGLGWGLPAAVGLKLARPDRTVVATVGDGAYLFANPAACHQAMAMHGAPVLTIVCTNEKWGAVESSALAVHPAGAAAVADLTPMARLRPSPHYAAYAEASGGYGERVTERSELVPALRRALHAVEVEGRQALVDVACT